MTLLTFVHRELEHYVAVVVARFLQRPQKTKMLHLCVGITISKAGSTWS